MFALMVLSAAIATPENCATTAVQSDLNDCALIEYERADRALNAQWKATIKVYEELSQEDARRLRTAQRAWLAFRDAECWARHPFTLGVSLDKMLHINCRTNLTIERTRTLSDLAKDR